MIHTNDLFSFAYASFIRAVNATVWVSGTFNLFNVTCKQHCKTKLNPFLNGTKTVTLTVNVNDTKRYLVSNIPTLMAQHQYS